MAISPCRHHFPPSSLDIMACPQLSPLGKVGACLAGTVVPREAQLSYAAVMFSPVGQEPQQPKPKATAEEICSSASQQQERISSFH